MAGASLVGFGIGAVGTVVGTLVAWRVLGPQMGPDGPKVHADAACSLLQFLSAVACARCSWTVICGALFWRLPVINARVFASHRSACGAVYALCALQCLASTDHGWCCLWTLRMLAIAADVCSRFLQAL